ncbi:uncharacterized protein [Apostichopus japonicus]|uniref:uncharacterized protein n=1 Tax=Stichopus japonicus TaxID=307972 RepID=UPI003AB45EB3
MGAKGNQQNMSVAETREVMDTLQQISELLNTGLTPEVLTTVVQLCELGVNPEALASVIRELRSAAAGLQSSSGDS